MKRNWKLIAVEFATGFRSLKDRWRVFAIKGRSVVRIAFRKSFPSFPWSAIPMLVNRPF